RHVALRDYLDDPPALFARERTRFGDAHDVAQTALVVLVVRLVALRHLHRFTVKAVPLVPIDAHDHSLVHLVADDRPDLQLLLCRHLVTFRDPSRHMPSQAHARAAQSVLARSGASPSPSRPY